MTINKTEANLWRGCKGFIDAVQGNTLVVGSKLYKSNTDRRLLYKDSIGLDMLSGDGVDLVHDLEQPLPDDLLFDHIDCCSVLEHTKRPWVVAENLQRCMRPGATILICVPMSWRVHGYPDDYWRLTISAIEIIFPEIIWQDRFYLINGKVRDKVPVDVDQQERHWIERTETVGIGRKLEISDSND